MTPQEWGTLQVRAWKRDANLYVRQCLGATPDRWQAHALTLVSNPATRRLAPELLKWMNRSQFLQASFVWTRSVVMKRGNENWFAAKRTWPKSGDADAQSNALAGLHADDVMFVLDESGGIPQGVMVTAEAVLATFVPGSGHRALVVPLLGVEEVETAMKRHYRSDAYDWAQKRRG